MKKKYGLFRLLVAVFLIVGGYKLMFESGLDRDRRWVICKQENKQLVIITKEKNESRYKKMVFPAEVLVETADNKGEYRLATLRDLEGKHGQNWYESTVAEQFANGVCVFERQLSWGDRLLLVFQELRGNIEIIEAKAAGFLDDKQAPDGAVFAVINDKWRKYKSELFLDSALSGQESYVWIENASDIPGLGTYAAESADNAGVHVFDVAKSEQVLKKCELVVSEEFQNSLTVRWLKERFDCNLIKEDSEKDIILKVGEEWGNRVRGFLARD